MHVNSGLAVVFSQHVALKCTLTVQILTDCAKDIASKSTRLSCHLQH